jgi:hypothetical protein
LIGLIQPPHLLGVTAGIGVMVKGLKPIGLPDLIEGEAVARSCG